MDEHNLANAQQLLEKLSAGAPPAEVATLLSEDISFEIPGDVLAFPLDRREDRAKGVR